MENNKIVFIIVVTLVVFTLSVTRVRAQALNNKNSTEIVKMEQASKV